MLVIFVLQLIVPLGLILWLALAPASSRLAVAVQASATMLALFAIGLMGVWLFPPRWVPWLYMALFVMAVAIALRKRRKAPWWPPRWWRWGLPVAFLAVGGYAAFESAHMLAARQSPELPHVDLVFPLAGSAFLVLNGGNDVRINSHLKTMYTSEPRLLAWRGNGYGVDVVAIDRWGMRVRGVQPTDPSLYRIFGMPVLAPCSGAVVKAVDGLSDMTVPEYDRANMAGNHVIIECGDNHVVMAHFRKGSVLVRAGDAVQVGQKLAEVGNSGGTDEPHLHIHAQRPGTMDAPMSGDPLPARFDGRFLVRGNRIVSPGQSLREATK